MTELSERMIPQKKETGLVGPVSLASVGCGYITARRAGLGDCRRVWRQLSSSPAKVFRESEDADDQLDASGLPGLWLKVKFHNVSQHIDV